MNDRLVVRAGHARIQDMCWREDGLILATLGTVETGIYFWETWSSKLIGVWQGHPRLQHFWLCQDRILTWGDGRCCLWDIRSLERGQLDFALIKVFSGLEGSQPGSRFFLLSGSTIRVVDSRNGKLRSEFPKERWAYLSPRGRRLTVGNQLFSTVSGREIYKFDQACALTVFSPEERWVAVAGYNDKFFSLFDLDRSRIIRYDTPQSKRIISLEFSFDGLYLACLDEVGGLMVVDTETASFQWLACKLRDVQLLGWLTANRLVIGNKWGAYQQVEVVPENLHMGEVIADGESGLDEGGRWLLGPDGLALWTQGATTVIRQLSRGQIIGLLPAPLRLELGVQQQLVGDTIIINNQAWDLQRGKPLALANLLVVSGQLVTCSDDICSLDKDLYLKLPLDTPDLRALCNCKRLAAFSSLEGRRLDIWRRHGRDWSHWRTAPELACRPQDVQFSESGYLLHWQDDKGHCWVWLAELNCLFHLDGQVTLLPDGWVEVQAAGKVCLCNNRGQAVRAIEGDTKWLRSYCLANNSILLVAPQRAEIWDLTLQHKRIAFELPGLLEAVVVGEGKFLAGLLHSGDLGLWHLPAGQPWGQVQPFHPPELPYLKFISRHGLLLVWTSKECGCWFLDDANFEWLRFGEPWLSGAYPMPGKQVLLLTQDGAWHLYSGRPLSRTVSLRTADNGGWIALSADNRWDASSELSSLVSLESGGTLSAAQKDLWHACFSGLERPFFQQTIQ